MKLRQVNFQQMNIVLIKDASYKNCKGNAGDCWEVEE